MSGRSLSPKARPEDLPQPSREELDFDDPPAYIRNPFTQVSHILVIVLLVIFIMSCSTDLVYYFYSCKVFWCLNKKVRDKVLENMPKPVFFCFHKGFCTYQVREAGGRRRPSS